jgi:hypothetical protein
LDRAHRADFVHGTACLADGGYDAERLDLMDRAKLPHGLDLHDKLATNDVVWSPLTDNASFVLDIHGGLASKRNPSQPKLHGQCLFVHTLQKTGSEVPMDLYRRSYNSTSQVVHLLAWLRKHSLGVLGLLAAVHQAGSRQARQNVAWRY